MPPIEREELAALWRARSEDSASIIRLQEQVKNQQGLIDTMVTKAEFGPVKLIAYGLATLSMSSVVLAVLAKVIVK